MGKIRGASRRLLRGRRLRSDLVARRRVRKWVAGPLYGSDAISSLSYGPDQILLTLALAGASAYVLSFPVAVVVAAVLLIVAVSYRQTVKEYPKAGGDYEVARSTLGNGPGLLAAGAMMVDYLLVVAVSVSAAVYYVGTIFDWVDGREAVVTAAAIAVVTLIALRGWSPRRLLGALPVYLFVGAVLVTVAVGWLRVALGDPPVAESAEWVVTPTDQFAGGLTGLAAGVLVLRAFSVGSVSLTGVQTLTSAVGSFRAPRGDNAASALMRVALVSALMLVSVVALARVMDVQVVEDVSQLTIDGVTPGEDFRQHPVLEQLASGVMSQVPWAFGIVAIAATAVLVLAAFVTYEAFPGLASVLARDGFLPRQMHLRSDRLTFSVGIAALGIAAIVIVLIFDAEVSRLIDLYIVGVFTAFTLSQAGMVLHWTRMLAEETRRDERAHLMRSRLVSATGGIITASILVVLLLTKLTRGAWLTLLMIAIVVGLMYTIKRHYVRVAAQTRVTGSPDETALPSRVHAIVLVSRIDKPTMRAISYARGTGARVLEAVTVDVSPAATRAIIDEWQDLDVPVPLRVLDSPYREITRPVAAYVDGIRTERPRDVVVVYLPEFVVRKRWQRLLHNRSSDALRASLMETPGVMVTSVPWVARDGTD